MWDEKLIVGTSQGEILMFENGELKGVVFDVTKQSSGGGGVDPTSNSFAQGNGGGINGQSSDGVVNNTSLLPIYDSMDENYQLPPYPCYPPFNSSSPTSSSTSSNDPSSILGKYDHRLFHFYPYSKDKVGIRSLVPCSKGFIAACENGTIYIFEKRDDLDEGYGLSGSLQLESVLTPNKENVRQLSTYEQFLKPLPIQLIISPSEEHLVVTTNTQQVLFFNLSSSEIMEKNSCRTILGPLHSPLPTFMSSSSSSMDGGGGHGGRSSSLNQVKAMVNGYSASIVDMSCALWKPIVSTIGSDGTLKLWDYENKQIVLHKTFLTNPFSNNNSKSRSNIQDGLESKDDDNMFTPSFQSPVEQLTTVALHPSGMQIIIGFQDRVTLNTVLINDVKEILEIGVRGCKISRFSKRGQFFCLVNGTNIMMYDTFEGDQIFMLRGHSAKIKNVEWVHDDQNLVSVSVDGSCILWNALNGTKLNDFTIRRCPFSHGVPLPYEKEEVDNLHLVRKASGENGGMVGMRVVVLTSESIIREVEIEDEMVHPAGSSSSSSSSMEMDSSQQKQNSSRGNSALNQRGSDDSSNQIGVCLPYPATLSCSCPDYGLVFFGSNQPSSILTPGAVMVYKAAFGGKEGAIIGVHTIHSSPITTMFVPSGTNLLVSGDCDGNVYISRFTSPHPPTSSLSTASLMSASSSVSSHHQSSLLLGTSGREYIEEVLVQREDIRQQEGTLNELKKRVEQLKLDSEFQLRTKDQEYREKIKEVSANFTVDLESHKQRYKEMLQEKQELQSEFEEQLNELDDDHAVELVELERNYTGKINAEISRFEELNLEKEELHRKMDAENQQLAIDHSNELQELTHQYEEKVGSEQYTQKKLQDNKENLILQFERKKMLIEDDADGEVITYRGEFEGRLNDENRTLEGLLEEHESNKRELDVLQNKSEEHKAGIEHAKDKEIRLYEAIRGLERDIQSHKKEIKEREEAMAEKDARVVDLKRKNQELEKFKFVLDYKIKELRRQIAPRENEITDMRRQIEEMDLELEQYHKSNSALNLMISELKLKLKALQGSVDEFHETSESQTLTISHIRRDLMVTKSALEEERAKMSHSSMLGGAPSSTNYLLRTKKEQPSFATKQVSNRIKPLIVAMYRMYVQEEGGEGGGHGGGGGEEDGGGGGGGGGMDLQEVYNRQREHLERNLEGLRRNAEAETKMSKKNLSRLQRENVMLTGEMNSLVREAALLTNKTAALERTEGCGGNINMFRGLMGMEEIHSNPPTPHSPSNQPLSSSSTPSQRQQLGSSSGRQHLVSRGSIRGGMTDWSEVQKEVNIQRSKIGSLEEQVEKLCMALGLNSSEVLSTVQFS